MIKKLFLKYKELPVQVKASIWFLICSFLQKSIAAITTPIFTRLMNTTEYGAFNVFLSWQGIVTIFVSFNLSYGVFSQGLIKYEDDRKKYSSSMQGLALTLIGIWILVYFFTRNFWNSLFSMNTFQMIMMFLIIWSSAVYEFWASEKRVEYNYVSLVIVTIIASFFTPVLGIVLVSAFEDKVTARIISIAVTGVVLYFPCFLFQIIRGKAFYCKKYWKHALLFALPLVPHYLSQTVLNSSDRIMIQEMVDNSSAGIYSLAYSISLLMTIFNTALMQTITPWLYKKIKENEILSISKVAYSTLIIIGIMNLFLIIFAPELVRIFAPKEYYVAIWVIPPIAMSVFFMYAYDLFAKFAFYYEKTKMIAIATAVGAILNIILNYFFIPKFGYYAAGYTTLFCYILYAFMHYLYMRKVCNDNCKGIQPYNIKIILFITIPFLILGFAILFTYNFSIVRYMILSFALIIILIKHKFMINKIKQIVLLKNNK